MSTATEAQVQQPVKPIEECTIEEIQSRLIECAKFATIVKNNVDALKAELTKRTSETALKLYANANKEHGDLTFEVDGVKLKGSIERKIEYDQDALRAVAATMPWEKASRIFKIEFDVAEATYKAITDDELRTAITAARTVKTGELKVALAPAK